MIPQRTLSGTCEITTGALAITQRPPIYTGENAALKVEVSFTFQNVAYPIPSGVEAEMYLKFPNTEKMTVAVPMEISGNTASGVLSGEQTGLEGYPLLIVQLTDTETASLIVACATTVKVSNVRGNLVVDTRAPTPSEIVYVGRSPYIDPTTKHWITWDTEQAKYVDTGINAEGVIGYTPSISIGTVQSVPTGESAEVTRAGTDENPVFNFKLPRSGDGVGIYPVDMTIAVAEWVEESGVYKYTFPDATIKAHMTVLESWLDDEAVQLGKVWYTVNNGSLVVNTDIVPTAAWALHVTLGTNGTDVLEDVADLESRFPVSIANGGTGGTTAAEARQALGITQQFADLQTELAGLAFSGTTNTSGNTIKQSTFFWLNNVLCVAKTDILNGATFTKNTNYREMISGALNEYQKHIINTGRYSIAANADEWTYTGVNITIPAKCFFAICGIIVYQTAAPKEISIQRGKESPYEVFNGVTASGGFVSLAGYNDTETTFYLYGKWKATGNEQGEINGWYEKIIE